MPRISRRLVAAATTLALALPPSLAGGSGDVSSGDVTFHRDGAFAELANSRVARRWQIVDSLVPRQGVYSVGLRDVQTGKDWLDGQRSPDFTLSFGGGVVRSSQMAIQSLEAAALPDGTGVKVSFGYEPAQTSPLPETISIRRDVTLHSGSGAFEVTSVLHNGSPSPLVVSAYSLDEVWPNTPPFRSEVHRYVDGSDWREDFRVIRTHGYEAFDDEGEVARFDDFTDAGWFFVSERRGGAMSRVGFAPEPIEGAGGSDRDRTWAGADFARDLLDLGPITYDTPETNRVENPAYPVPVRARRVAPFSDLRLGTVATGLYHGGESQAAATYVDYLVRHRQPAFPRQVTYNSYHPWRHSTAYNEATIQAQADVAATLGVDTMILDDTWQGVCGTSIQGACVVGTGESGDWGWDTARFPDRNSDGRGDIADYIESKGMKLGLWMNPAEFNGSSSAARLHPQWVCQPIGTITGQIPDDAGLGVWNFNVKDFREYMTSVLDRIIVGWNVHYFKFDFQTWVDCPPHDYNDYEDAFVGWVDALEAEYPNVTFEFDETNDQRMWAFESVARGPSWFDNGTGTPREVLHDIWSAAPWINPSTLGMGLYDDTLAKGFTPDYLMPMAALTHMTFWTDLTKLSTQQRSDTQWWLSWYHANASKLGGLVYELTSADPNDGVSAAAFQPWDAASDSGFLFTFCQSGASPAPHLQGLIADRSYLVMNVRDGTVLGTFTGADLATGNVSWPTMVPQSAAVYSVSLVV